MIVLKFDTNIPGATGIQGHEDWIGVDSLNWSVNRMVSFPSTGAQERKPGNPNFSEVAISKKSDKASPLLWDQATHGQSLGKCVIRFLQSAGDSGADPVAFLVITLHDAIISSYAVSGTGDYDPTETFTINYTQAEYQYDPHSGTAAESGENKTWSMKTGTTKLA
jgi:type VI secretion system secreted protein Hcp